jgi:mono/diheme cytochrome c family protein
MRSSGVLGPVLVLALFGAAGAAGCHKNSRDMSARLANVPRESQDIFSQRCANCHGTDGSGNGPAAAALTPHPRNFGDGTWQHSVTDDHIRQIIVGGGPSVGKSPLMPPNPDLQGNARVVDGLLTMVRAFGT